MATDPQPIVTGLSSTSVTMPPVTPPLTVQIQGGTLQQVESIAQGALDLISLIPPTHLIGEIGNLILGIVSAAANRIQSQTGKPIDITLIPYEQPLP